jgi:hypothetical protein
LLLFVYGCGSFCRGDVAFCYEVHWWFDSFGIAFAKAKANANADDMFNFIKWQILHF